MGATTSKSLQGIIIPVNLPRDASFEQFSKLVPADIFIRLKKQSFLFDAGRPPICNARILPLQSITTLEGVDNYKICRIKKFFGYRKSRATSIKMQNGKLHQMLTENAIRSKGGESYMYWQSIGYGYKLHHARSKFPSPKHYANPAERDRKNPYISIILPENGTASIEQYITSMRTAKVKLQRKEIAGAVLSRIKGLKLITKYNATEDPLIRKELVMQIEQLRIK